jgi:hydroxymethylbilane synthase
LILEAIVATVDGDRLIRRKLAGEANHPESLGEELAQLLLSGGAAEILEALRQH